MLVSQSKLIHIMCVDSPSSNENLISSKIKFDAKMEI